MATSKTKIRKLAAKPRQHNVAARRRPASKAPIQSGPPNPYALGGGGGAPVAIQGPAAAAAAYNPMQPIIDQAHTQGATDIAGANTQYELGVKDLDLQFFDPANEFSEMNKIKMAEAIARKRSINSMGNHIFGGSFINQENITSQHTRENEYTAQLRYKELLKALAEKRDTTIAGINAHLTDVDLQGAGALADDPANTTPAAPAAANPLAGLAGIAEQLGSSFGKGNPFYDSTVTRAFKMWHAGNKSGKDWKSILNFLGYDPRKGGKLVFK